MSLKIALAGNPNCGKTTLFNALTGSNQFVGNWPGVTVEKKEGKLKGHDGVVLTDLPGIYSLSPYTPEEVAARNYLVDERPDAILNIVDGTNLERNLYLTTQLTELGIPVVLAINMMDVVRKSGDKINIELLSRKIGCKVVEISALKGEGAMEAAELAIQEAKRERVAPKHIFSGEVEHAIAHIEEAAIHDMPQDKQRWYAIKIFERDERVLKALNLPENTVRHVEEDVRATEKELDDDAESIIINERYVYIASVLDGCFEKKNKAGLSVSDQIDRVVTNRFAALPIFIAIMFCVYYVSVSTVGTWVTDFMNDGLFGDGFYLFGIDSLWIPGIPVWIESGLDAINCAVWLKSLVVDGIVGGVGAVLGFVPQILVLFLFLGFLEACGYMSRIAFMMDKIFRKFGLSGKSFIPMLIGSGCTVPGIMATRTIENERDRRMTVMITHFVPCGAKLPVIALVASVFFSDAWWVAPLAYFIGIAAIVVSGLILKKTRLFAGDPAPFVMELPAYHLPTLGNLMHGVWERGWAFVKKAGTVILLATVVVWAMSRLGFEGGKFLFDVDMALENSLIGYLGKGICWIFAPLGFGSIRATVATVMGLVAKEQIVAVFGVLDFEGMGRVAACSFLVFNLLCAPCIAAMAAIRREMNHAKWTWFTLAYQTAFAYAVSFIIYQLGTLFTGGAVGIENVVGALCAVALIGVMVCLIVRPDQKKGKKNF